jgi:hypothetical protein
MVRSFLMLSCLILGGSAAWTAEEPAHPAPYAPRDPVVADVLRMSGGGVSEAAIVEWLRRTRPAVAPLDADDLIGLSQAKVPQGVITELIGLAGPPPAAAAAAPPAPAPAPVPAADPNAPIPVRWTVSYRAASEVDEVPPDLALYLDGQLLVRVPGARAEDRQETVNFARPLPSGATVIRVLRERHEEHDGAWRHDTRVVGEPITLEVPPGPRVAVKIEYRDNWLGLPRPPLAWSVERDDEVLSSREKQGGDPERWPWLCEDTEASLGKRGPDSVQRYRLKGCVRWASLWGDAAGVPARDVQLREFAAQGFGEFVPK